ncbi:MAG: hypothetical protein HQK53_19795, partial [Oligoflexia bacterium]|nr:hypothetical protein [Oligoflexia bacterium]
SIFTWLEGKIDYSRAFELDGKGEITRRSYRYMAEIGMELPIAKTIDLHLDATYFFKVGNFEEEMKGSVNSNALIGYIFSDISPGWNLIPRVGVNYATKGIHRKHNEREITPIISPLWLWQQENGNIATLTLTYYYFDKIKVISDSLNDRYKEFAIGLRIGEIVPITSEKGFSIIYGVTAEIGKYYAQAINNHAATVFVEDTQLGIDFGFGF